MNLVFVCNANIVRSFMAERMLKHLLKSRGMRDIEVSSAGLLDMHGAPADKTARHLLQERGIDDEGHQSRLLTEAMIEEADLIIAMEMKQVNIIGDQYPSAIDKISVLKSYLPESDYDKASIDIKDPHGQSIFYYRLCFAEITLAMEKLMECI